MEFVDILITTEEDTKVVFGIEAALFLVAAALARSSAPQPAYHNPTAAAQPALSAQV